MAVRHIPLVVNDKNLEKKTTKIAIQNRLRNCQHPRVKLVRQVVLFFMYGMVGRFPSSMLSFLTAFQPYILMSSCLVLGYAIIFRALAQHDSTRYICFCFVYNIYRLNGRGFLPHIGLLHFAFVKTYPIQSGITIKMLMIAGGCTGEKL